MREIKFRAFHKKRKYMTELVGLSDVQVHGETVVNGRHYNIRRQHNLPTETTDSDFFEMVTPAEVFVMQYTGLKDKNGVEIYEGDIVKNPDGVGEVQYIGSGFFVKIGENRASLLQYFGNKEQEVIGNTYENKELLK